jgi:hypothetical protein
MGTTVITVSSVNDSSLFKAVLAAPSMADMVFMSPSSLCTFYPQLTLENNAILSSTGFLVDPEMSIGSVWSECFYMYDDAGFFMSPYGLTCPFSGRTSAKTICLSFSMNPRKDWISLTFRGSGQSMIACTFSLDIVKPSGDKR